MRMPPLNLQFRWVVLRGGVRREEAELEVNGLSDEHQEAVFISLWFSWPSESSARVCM